MWPGRFRGCLRGSMDRRAHFHEPSDPISVDARSRYPRPGYGDLGLKRGRLAARQKPPDIDIARRKMGVNALKAHPSYEAKRALCGFLLGLDQVAVEQALGNLDGVERGALAQIVGDAPELQTVLYRGVLADAADVGGVLTRRLVGRHIAAGLTLVDH